MKKKVLYCLLLGMSFLTPQVVKAHIPLEIFNMDHIYAVREINRYYLNGVLYISYEVKMRSGKIYRYKEDQFGNIYKLD